MSSVYKTYIFYRKRKADTLGEALAFEDFAAELWFLQLASALCGSFFSRRWWTEAMPTAPGHGWWPA